MITRAEHPPYDFNDGLEQFVACTVTKSIIDFFKIVNIDVCDSHWAAISIASLDFYIHEFVKQASIDGSSEKVRTS